MKKAEKVFRWTVPPNIFSLAKRIVSDAPDNREGLRAMDPVQRDLWRKVFEFTHKYSSGRNNLAAIELFPPEANFVLDMNREKWLRLHHLAFPLHSMAEYFSCAHPFNLAHVIRCMDDRIEQWPDAWCDVNSVPYLTALMLQEGEKGSLSSVGNRVWKLGCQIVQNEDTVGTIWLGDRYTKDLIPAIQWALGSWIPKSDDSSGMAMTLMRYTCTGAHCHSIELRFTAQMGYICFILAFGGIDFRAKIDVLPTNRQPHPSHPSITVMKCGQGVVSWVQR